MRAMDRIISFNKYTLKNDNIYNLLHHKAKTYFDPEVDVRIFI